MLLYQTSAPAILGKIKKSHTETINLRCSNAEW